MFSRPELRLSDGVRFEKGGGDFKVYEVDVNGVQALPSERASVSEVVTCLHGEVLRYVLCKENLPTPDAVRLVSRALGSEVAYAGIKDAEGFTCQFVTIKCRPGDVFRSNYELFGGRVMLFFRGYDETMLRRGELGGNLFEVSLSGLNAVDAATLNELRTRYRSVSFLNYYGYQRFGSRRPVTHLVGKALLKGDLREAVDLILGRPYPTESSGVAEARRAYDRGDLKEALDLFPRKFRFERLLLRELIKGRDLRRTLRVIDEWLLKMYVEAFQSYLFNLSLSRLALSFGGVDELERTCEVLPLPGTNVRTPDKCAQESIKLVAEELKELTSKSAYSRYLREGARETTFTLQELTLELNENNASLCFLLKPSTYATIFIRELVGAPPI